MRLHSQAQNLKRILDAFEEEGWPQRIDDPLPPSKGRDHSERMRDAVRRLNEHLRETPLRFESAGDGEGICWYTVK